MKNKIIITFMLLAGVLTCSCKDNTEMKQKDSSKSEVQKLEEIKKEKQAESDSLKKEIEKLKRQRDSLKAVETKK